MSFSSVEVLLKLNQIMELHKLYFDSMANSFNLIGVQHHGIMLLLQSVEQCFKHFKQQLDWVEQQLRRVVYLQQESRGVGTQVPSGN